MSITPSFPGSIAQYNRVKTKYYDANLLQPSTTSNDVENASYVRLNYLQLAYDFDLGYPKKFIKNSAYFFRAITFLL